MFLGCTPLLPGTSAPNESGLASSADVCGTSAIVSGAATLDAGQFSGARRERTQHTRPSIALERSVLHNEWEKSNFY